MESPVGDDSPKDGLRSRESIASLTLKSPSPLQSRESADMSEKPLLYKSESTLSTLDQQRQRRPTEASRPRTASKPPQTTVQEETFACEEDTQNYHLIERPNVNDVNEILSLLKVGRLPVVRNGLCQI